jgi:hypothetical protein
MQDLLTGKVRVKIDENKKEPAAAWFRLPFAYAV